MLQEERKCSFLVNSVNWAIITVCLQKCWQDTSNCKQGQLLPFVEYFLIHESLLTCRTFSEPRRGCDWVGQHRGATGGQTDENKPRGYQTYLAYANKLLSWLSKVHSVMWALHWKPESSSTDTSMEVTPRVSGPSSAIPVQLLRSPHSRGCIWWEPERAGWTGWTATSDRNRMSSHTSTTPSPSEEGNTHKHTGVRYLNWH